MKFTSCVTLFLATVVSSTGQARVGNSDERPASENQNFKLNASVINFAEIKNNNSKTHADFSIQYDQKFKLSENFNAGVSLGFVGVTYPDYAFTAPELYIDYKFDEKSTISFGRKKIETSSYLDSDWFLGLQTSFLRMNPLYPEEQGRAGLSFSYHSDQVTAHFYGSPVSIPDQFPGFDLTPGGQVTTNNPWSNLPPEQVRFDSGSEFDISYELVNDSVPDLILDHQFGGSLGIKTDYLELVGMYSNRPSKQLNVELEAKLQTDQEGSVVIRAEPAFLREHFYGLQAKSKWSKGVILKNGFYGLILEDDDLDAKYQTSHPDYFFITTELQFNIKKYGFSLKHIYTKERSNERDGVVYIDFSRFLYRNAVWLEATNFWLDRIRSNIGAIYSYEEKVARFYVESTYQARGGWSYWGRLNLIHEIENLTDEENISVVSGLASYAALDSFNVGVRYVF
jgi:hypothetical protein